MTPRTILTTAALLTGLGLGATAVAQSNVPYPVQARQGQFTLMQLNTGVLGNMVRGRQDYDAGLAQAAADNLVTLSQLDQSFHWPEGTDNASIEGTLALPAIWENLPGVISRWEDFGTEAAAMAAVAGNGLDAVQAQIGALSGTCTACHDDFRANP
jgi:cytochrome c556